VLVVRSGPLRGSKYRISGSFRIGRHPANHLLINESKISRFHALIEPSDGHCTIRDLGSRNGTWVNGKKTKVAQLKQGDEIRIGQVGMEFFAQPVPETAPTGKTTSVDLPTKSDATVRLRTPSEKAEAGGTTRDMKISDSVIRDNLNRLEALYHANILLNSEMELEEIFQASLKQIFHFLAADRGVILLLDPVSQELELKYSLTRQGESSEENILMSRTIAQQVLQRGYGLLIDDAQTDQRFSMSESIVEQNIRSALCVPLVHHGETLGIIYLDVLSNSSAFGKDDLRMLTAMAAPSAVQIRNFQYLDQLARAYMDTIQGLANAIEARDHYTVGHAFRVTRIALAMADRLGWSPKQQQYTEMGGLLHDIGKIGIEDAILRKKGPLTPEEFQKMRLHPEYGARILNDIEFLKPALPYVLFHQERWDGKGYPFELSGEDIAQEGRLLAVCDAFDAMTSQRPYRGSLSIEQALEEVRKSRGKQFDPGMVDVFFEIWEAGEIKQIIHDPNKDAHSIPCPFCSTEVSVGNEPREGMRLECTLCAKKFSTLLQDGEWKGNLL
jgi:HD-GYP domain-containing protein (c-di-GMP phosphodiesterase class II)